MCLPYPPVLSALEVLEDVLGSVQVTLRWVVEVGGEEADGRSDVRTGAQADPIEASYDGLVEFDEFGFVLRWEAIMGIAVNGVATLVGSVNWIGSGEGELVKHLVNVTFLGAVNCEAVVRGMCPLIVDT